LKEINNIKGRVMQKRLNKYEQFKIYMKLIKEGFNDVLNKDEVESPPEDFIEKKTDESDTEEDTPGVIKTNNPRIKSLYDKLMTKYEPSQLIYDDKQG
jgi:hypothetical protein